MIKHLSDIIKKDFNDYQIVFRIHATKRMFQRSINRIEVETILHNGIIIEEYKEDFPFNSILINGKTNDNRPLHLLVGVNSDEMKLIIITVYEPDPKKWESNYSRRAQ